MVRAMSGGLALVLLGASPALAFDPGSIGTSSLRALTASGPLVLVDDGVAGPELVTAGVLVDATPDEVWAAISDYEAYPTWMPDVVDVDVVATDGAVQDAEFHLQFNFSVISKKLDYTLRHTEDRAGNQITWTAIAGDVTTTTGSWQLVPVDGGSRTLAFYSTYTDLLEMGWIVKSLLKEQPSMNVAIQTSTAVTVATALKDHLDG